VKILIVDDSTAMRMIVLRTLRKAGYGGHDIKEAANGVEGLELVRSWKPELVLSGWNMPEMTGIQMLRRIVAERLDTIFGFVTTECAQEMITIATAAGARFVIVKPFTPDDFEKALGEVFG